jgi:hypothetical protein
VKKPKNPQVKAKGDHTPKSTSQSTSSAFASRMPKQIVTIQAEPIRSGTPRHGSTIIWFWKEFWAIAGPILTLAGAWFLFSPQISIEPSVNTEPSQPLATQFLITNRGHVTVYDVHFRCGLGGSPAAHIGDLLLSSLTITPVSALPPGASVTRSCALESEDIRVPDINITATYRWPIIGWQSSQTAHFSLRHGTPGFFLVPDFR